MDKIEKKIWTIAAGFIPEDRDSKEPGFNSHETACIFNPNSCDARIDLKIFFNDQDLLQYGVFVKAQRTLHLRFNDLEGPEIPRDTNFSALFCSDEPIIIQQIRLGSRPSDQTLLSALAYSE